jgi:RimJ/RimL family protein N-acetyltransferase
MLKFIPSAENPWIENYAILLRGSENTTEDDKPRMVGTVGTTRLSDDDAMEIAYGLHSDYWGRGYMSEALGMFIKLYWGVESKYQNSWFHPGEGLYSKFPRPPTPLSMAAPRSVSEPHN